MGFVRPFAYPALASVAGLLLAVPAQAQEPAACFGATPPPPAKPYLLILADTSGSMDNPVGVAPDCDNAAYPATYSGHLRCGLYRAADSLGGSVRVGLMAYPAVAMSGSRPDACPNSMLSVPGCTYQDRGCGEGSGRSRSSAHILVPIAADNYWAPDVARTPSNVAAALELLDNRCGNCRELPASGSYTPINGALRDAFRYLSSELNVPAPYASQRYPTPLVGGDLERPCRQVHVVVVTDGGENCDTDADPNGTGAVNAARTLLEGFEVGGVHWSVKTHVIKLGGNSVPAYEAAVAQAGGTTAILASTSRELADAITRIGTGSIGTEVCDNLDNNCNGCIDEGFHRYCNRDKIPRTIAEIAADPANRTVDVCCSDARGQQNGLPGNDTCFGRFYQAAANAAERPVWWLPCVTTAAGALVDPQLALCESPGERCDELDNNCDPRNVADEGITKCLDGDGNLACPTPEQCDGRDNDCNGIVDDVPGDGAACVTPAGCAGVGQCTVTGFACVPSTGPEICDGIDNDCDGLVDEVAEEDAVSPMIDVGAPCGSSVGECRLGVRTCVERGTASARLACVGGVEPLDHDTCDGKDNDCDGLVDEDSYPEVGQSCAACGMSGTYQCRGAIVCVSGPQVGGAELCNGQDDNCDGNVDENVPGVGEPCGTELSSCGRGVYVCGADPDTGVVALRCERPAGAPAPSAEVCDGKDNNCDGTIDEGAVCPGEAVCVQGRCVEPIEVPSAPAEPQPEPGPEPVPAPEPAPTPPDVDGEADGVIHASGSGCAVGSSAGAEWLVLVGLLGLARRRRAAAEGAR